MKARLIALVFPRRLSVGAVDMVWSESSVLEMLDLLGNALFHRRA